MIWSCLVSMHGCNVCNARVMHVYLVCMHGCNVCNAHVMHVYLACKVHVIYVCYDKFS